MTMPLNIHAGSGESEERINRIGSNPQHKTCVWKQNGRPNKTENA
jgi:hypothetical protein